MKQQLLIHCGGKTASIDDLQAVPLPPATPTYQPISHYDLVINIERVTRDMLPNYRFDKGNYALSKDGQRLFGVLTYQNDTPDMGLSIGLRNSYNKTMSVGIAIGATVFVCDNLAFSGEITVLRKHTANVVDDLETAILKVLYKAKVNFTSIVESAEQLKGIPLSDDAAFKLLGLLFGRQILTPRQLLIAKNEWHEPSHDAFEPRNAWSFYNATTAALKSTAPNRIIERHISLHDLMTQTLLG